MLFLMSFALIHGFRNSAMLAGAKLAIIPVAIGIIAPLGIALGKERGVRLICAGGMALSGASVLALSVIANHPIGSLYPGLTAFAVFGAGLGFFLAPNNHATLEAAAGQPVRPGGGAAQPPARAGQLHRRVRRLVDDAVAHARAGHAVRRPAADRRRRGEPRPDGHVRRHGGGDLVCPFA